LERQNPPPIPEYSVQTIADFDLMKVREMQAKEHKLINTYFHQEFFEPKSLI
jgi:hypothetical protein